MYLVYRPVLTMQLCTGSQPNEKYIVFYIINTRASGYAEGNSTWICFKCL